MQSVYRRIPRVDSSGPGTISKVDGDKILFGRGPDGSKLGDGPLPILCNLKLAVARVMKMSGAADLTMRWKDEADDEDVPHNFIASEEFCGILDAKLLLSGHVFLI